MPISSATTAKPLPASPACAASIAAFSPSMEILPAMSLMAEVSSPMRSTLIEISLIFRVPSTMTSRLEADSPTEAAMVPVCSFVVSEMSLNSVTIVSIDELSLVRESDWRLMLSETTTAEAMIASRAAFTLAISSRRISVWSWTVVMCREICSEAAEVSVVFAASSKPTSCVRSATAPNSPIMPRSLTRKRLNESTSIPIPSVDLMSMVVLKSPSASHSSVSRQVTRLIALRIVPLPIMNETTPTRIPAPTQPAAKTSRLARLLKVTKNEA